MVLNQFPTAIAASAIATDWELNDYARLQGQERAFKAIVVPAESPEESVSDEAAETAEVAEEAAPEPLEEPVDEAAVVAWYEEHQQDYFSDEQVVVEYLELDASQLGGSIEPDEEVLKARFEEQKARFVTPESRLASHILIEVAPEAPQVDVETARQAADDLARRARDGEDFAELARESSQDIGSASEGGDLGWIEPGYMVKAFEDAVYELNLENPISDPVQTGFGWHVIYLRDIRPAEGMTFTEAREILAEEYRAEADEVRFIEQADRLVDIIYEDPTTLSAAAEELGLEIQQAGPFGRLGGEGIAANPGVVSAAFSDLVLGQGSVSDPVDLGENHIVLLRLKEHLPEALMPLEQVRERVVESVRRQRALDAASATAQELLAALQAGEDMQSLAEARELELVEAEAATRSSAELDATLRDQVFLMESPVEGGSVTQVVELSDGYAVVQLDRVTDGTLGEDDALRKAGYQRRIANASASSEALGFLRMLRAQSTIEIYEDRL